MYCVTAIKYNWITVEHPTLKYKAAIVYYLNVVTFNCYITLAMINTAGFNLCEIGEKI